ncbi:MAG: peptide chain release factor N(5)-glutamine methyltransferase [Verrucomicrobiota bacterium]
MTVLEIIQKSTAFLEKKGVDSPRLQSELLLAQVLGMPRLKLYLTFDKPLAEPVLERMRELLRRRGNREPLQHLLGTVVFCGLELAVDRRALIPRPETELLAEAALEFITTRPSDSAESPAQVHPAVSILDFGTGSGCLAIYLAVKLPLARIMALDISPEALALARQNAARHGVADRIEFYASDGFAQLPRETRFDLIVSNPPYIPTGDLPGLQPEVRDHDPHTALDGGADGLDYYRRLADEAPAHLKSKGGCLVEFGDGQELEIQPIFSAREWVVTAVKKDYTDRPRMLTAIRPDGKSGDDYEQ